MKVKLKTDEYTIFERRDGRFAVQDALGKPVNGAEKIEILLQHELMMLFYQRKRSRLRRGRKSSSRR